MCSSCVSRSNFLCVVVITPENIKLTIKVYNKYSKEQKQKSKNKKCLFVLQVFILFSVIMRNAKPHIFRVEKEKKK